VSGVRFNPGLDERVARMVRAEVNHLANIVADTARRDAPPVKVWMSVRDERVRDTHVEADGQAIPGNLHFKIPATERSLPGQRRWDPADHPRGDHGQFVDSGHHDSGTHNRGAGYEWATRPRDPELSLANRIACRCQVSLIPLGLARTIHAHAALVTGTKVSATVDTRYPRAAESEFGTARDEGAHFMLAGIREAKRRLGDVGIARYG
jgi:hypothetical protein